MTLARGLEWVPHLKDAAARLGETIESPGRPQRPDDGADEPGQEAE